MVIETQHIVREASPLRRQVVAALRQSILDFQYLPGQRLSERELCERYAVSRVVIREALRQLEGEGFVELIANVGARVAVVTAEQAAQLFEVREALEALLVRRFTNQLTPGGAARLRRAHEKLTQAYATGDLAGKIQAKGAFYRVLGDGAGNEVLAAMLDTVHSRVQALRAVTLGMPGRSGESLREIDAIVAAIVAGDADEAARIATLHVRHAGAAALAHLQAEDAALSTENTILTLRKGGQR